jgi:hypothetical protein
MTRKSIRFRFDTYIPPEEKALFQQIKFLITSRFYDTKVVQNSFLESIFL